MENLLNEARYRYAAIFGSALVSAWMLFAGLSAFDGANIFLKIFLFMFAAHIGALHGWFLMVCFDRLRGKITTKN